MSQVTILNKIQTNEKQRQDFNHPFLTELLKQFRLQDTLGEYQDLSDDLFLNKFLRKHQITSLNQLQIQAFYHAVGKNIEKETGKLAQIFVNLSHKGESSAVIFCGSLLVVYQLLEKISHFRFESIEELALVGDSLVESAVVRSRQFF